MENLSIYNNLCYNENDSNGCVNSRLSLTDKTYSGGLMAKKSLPKNQSVIKICSVEGCSGKNYSNGMCRIHYDRLRTYGRLHKLPPKTRGNCSLPDCNRPHYGRGYCHMHLQRLNKYGDVNFVKNDFGEGETRELRFWSKVALTANPEKCWEWQGCPDDNGYGLASYKGKLSRAHIIAWFLTTGKYPQKFLLHSCDNPPCVNPNHLREGTHNDNMQDKVERNRQSKGETSGVNVLTENQVKEIRREYRPYPKGGGHGKPGTIKSLARKYNVRRSTIRAIVTRQTWKEVE